MEQKRLKIVLLLTLVVLLLCSCATENLPAETQITINDTTEVGAMIDLYGDFTGSESDTSFADYPKAKLLTVSQDKTFSQNPLETTGEKTFLFSFVMKAKNVCTPVKISVIGENEIGETYYVPVQWTLIQMPMKLTQLSSVNLQFEGEVYLADAKIEYMGTTTLKNLSQQSGMHLLEDFYRSWYKKDVNGNTQNHGVAIRNPPDSGGYRYVEWRSSNHATQKPYIVINYISHAGRKGWWAYKTLSAGRAGSASVDLFNGNLVAEHPD